MIVKIKINGIDREVKEGGVLLNIFENLEIFVPHLCYLKNSTPSGKCGLCVVELNEEEIALSCLTKAKAGMVIKTESPKLSEIRQKNINNILRNHKINCFNCKKNGSCNLQAYVSRVYKNSDTKENFFGADRKIDVKKITKNLNYDAEKCIYCQRCSKFLSDICDQENLNISSIANLPESQNLTLNALDLCPVAALLEENSENIKSEQIICDGKQTYDVSDVFTPKICVLHQNNEFIKISGSNSILIRNETRNICKKLNSRHSIDFNYDEIIGKLAIKINSQRPEKKLFIIGNDIDLITFNYIKFLNDHRENVSVSIDDCNIPYDFPFNIGLENVDLSPVDLSIFVGKNIMSSDKCNILSNSLNIKKSETLKFNELSNFIENSESCSYNFPHIFLFSDVFNEFENSIILEKLEIFLNEFKIKFGRVPKINIIPSNLSKMFINDIPDYKSTYRITKELNKNDLEFICVIGDIKTNLQNYSGVDIICNSVFPIENATNIPAKHFLEDSAYYVNVFKKIVKTKQISKNNLKSNREFIFDIMKAVFKDDFYDINMEIHQSIRDKYFK